MKLKDWLKKDPPQAERLKVIGALCSALSDSHGGGVVLGGLTPAGVTVNNDGSVRLEPGASGTRYAAPELAQGAKPTQKADIYSAAAVIYEILSGKPPFESDPPRPLQETRPDLSQDLTDAVSACMEQDPEWRPADLAYLAAVVQQLRKDAPASSKAPAPRAPAPRASGPTPTFLNPAPSKRQDDRSALTRALPLILVVVAIAGTGGAWLWYNVLAPGPSATPAAARAPQAPPSAQAQPASAAAEPVSAADPLALPSLAPSAAAPGSLPTARPTEPAPSLLRATTPSDAPSQAPTPPPPRAAAAAPAPTTPAAATEKTDAGSVAAPPAEPAPEPSAPSDDTAAVEASGPAAIRAVAPFRLRAGTL